MFEVRTSSNGIELGRTNYPAAEDTLVWETTGNPDYLDPHVNYESYGDWIFYNTYETLYTYPWSSSDTSSVIPLLAEALPTISFDGMNYTITVRTGVTYHDGTPFNASCVKWNFERALKIFYTDGPAWILAESLKGGKAVEYAAFADGTDTIQFRNAFDNWIATSNAISVLDTYTLRIILEEPCPAFLSILSRPVASIISPSYAIAHASSPTYANWDDYGVDYGEYDNYMTSHTCGTGPYELTEWILNDHIELDINQDYWRSSSSTGAGSLEKIYLMTNEDTFERMSNLKTGLSDGCYWPIANALDIWDPDSQSTIDDNIPVSASGLSYDQFTPGFNMDSYYIEEVIYDSPFRNVHFRKAASYAFDYERFIDSAYNGLAVQGKGPIPIGLWGHNGNYFDYEYDLAVAVSEWNLAMADPSFVDSVNSLGNNLVFYYNAGNAERESFCRIMADGLREIWSEPSAVSTGLNLPMQASSQSLEWANYLDHIRYREMLVFFTTWELDYADPDNILFAYVYSNGVFPQRIAYNNSIVNVYFLAQRVETNMSMRPVLLNGIQEVLADDCPYLWAAQVREFRTWGHWLHGDGLAYNPMHKEYFYNMYKTEVIIWDTIHPQISSPDDISILFGTTGVSITWTATDENKDTYEIQRNGSIIDSGQWNSTEIIVSLDGLSVGGYNYTCIVEDVRNNTEYDTVFVTVTPFEYSPEEILAILVSFGSVVIIVLVAALVVKSRRQTG